LFVFFTLTIAGLLQKPSLPRQGVAIFVQAQVIILYVMDVHPITRFDVCFSAADGLSIFDDRLTHFDVVNGDLMSERDVAVARVYSLLPMEVDGNLITGFAMGDHGYNVIVLTDQLAELSHESILLS
jgi:hypothetical protein